MDYKNLSVDELISLVKSIISDLDKQGLHNHRLVAFGFLKLLEDVKCGRIDLSIDSFEVVGYEEFE